jgi:RND family efflux transporter MFP subunit
VLVALLASCTQQPAATQKTPTSVRVDTVKVEDYAPVVRITGEIRPRTQSELSFRTSGRITARNVDIGDHVDAGQLLATVDPTQQQANLKAAEATLKAANARVTQARAAFERQKTLLAQGFTTRSQYDTAEEALLTAQSGVASAQAQLETAREELTFTDLKTSAAGVVTDRQAEVGQVIQTAQPIFTVAEDGPRDAVFNVYESIFSNEPSRNAVEIALVSDPNVRTSGNVREVAPTVDPQTGTVRVKVGLDSMPPAMALGAPVVGEGRFKPRQRVILPWSALASADGKPAVWAVEPTDKTVALVPIEIAAYQAGQIIIAGGLKDGDVVVVDGGKSLRPGETVAIAEAVPQ